MILTLTFWEELILGLLQAILEWLPVSSEGFLILTAVNIFGEEAEAALRIALYFHLGTAISVLVKYWKVYWNMVFNRSHRNNLRFIIITTTATGVVGIPLYLLLKNIISNFSGMVVTGLIGILLLVTATLMRFGKLNSADKLEMKDRSVWDEILLGCMQGFAILPGISRSGTTTTFLLLRGFKKEDAFRMSFIISLPAIVGGIAFDLLTEDTAIIFSWSYLFIMVIVAVVGYFTMDFLLRFAKKVSFDVVCYILGGITLLLTIGYFILAY